jgi:calcineurin-like phosphoesterase family protein
MAQGKNKTGARRREPGCRFKRMLTSYTYNHGDESKVFFTSDTHFGHARLSVRRGFKTVAEHDAALIQRWNQAVRPQDTVIHLGDFVVGPGDEATCINRFNRLNGQIVLLWGNHLAGLASLYRECVRAQHGLDGAVYEVYPTVWNQKVTFVGASLMAHIRTPGGRQSGSQNHMVFCAHYAHRDWIDASKAVMHATGHAHGADEESNPTWKRGRRLDVGVDNFNFTPLGFDEFLRIMKTKTSARPAAAGEDIEEI